VENTNKGGATQFQLALQMQNRRIRIAKCRRAIEDEQLKSAYFLMKTKFA
jgi:hypothetical protein